MVGHKVLRTISLLVVRQLRKQIQSQNAVYTAKNAEFDNVFTHGAASSVISR